MCSIAEADRLADQITELASEIHAATCRWLGLVAKFDRCGGWGAWGARSCAHWLSWRCGISPVAAREHVRVAHRLESLPLIRAAFADGRLSYSQARALTRVEEVEHEEELLSLARHATAAQLEQLVRAYRGVVARARAGADGGAGPERWVAWSHADDGSLLLHARLPAEEGAVVLAALEAASERGASAEAPLARPDASAAGPPAVEGGASAEAPLAHASPGEPAVVEVGASAEAPTAAERRADALVLMADTVLADGAAARRGGDRFQVVVHLDADGLRSGEGDAELPDGTPLRAETARRLTCDASLVPLLERASKPLSVGRKTRSIPPALRRALASRDRGCRFPGCGSTRGLDGHHIEHWADGGPTSIDNLVELCRHHHRLLHEGGYSVGRRGGRLVFRRPDGRELRAVPRRRGCRRSLSDSNRLAGRTIEPEATVGLAAGERFDLGRNVGALLTFAPPDAPGI